MRKDIMLIVIIFGMITITGCWDYRDVEHMAIVSGIAVDYDDSSEGILITVEMVVPRVVGNQTVIESEIVQEKGENTFDAIRNMISKTGRKLFWSHAKVIIVSSELLNKKDLFIGLLDWFHRDDETRSDIWVVLSREKTSAEILLDSDTKIQGVKSYYLNDIIRNEMSVSKYRAVELRELIDELSSKGISPTLPTVSLMEEQDENSREKGQENAQGNSKGKEKEMKIPAVYGSAILRATTPIGWLDGGDTKTLLLLQDRLKGGLFVVEKDGTRTTLEIFESKTKIKPRIIAGEEISMDINIEIVVNLAEIVGEKDFIEEKERIELEKEAQRQIEETAKALLYKLQNKYKSDAVGFGNILERQEPKAWKTLEDSWGEIFPNVKHDIKVNLIIRSSALRSKPIKIKE